MKLIEQTRELYSKAPKSPMGQIWSDNMRDMMNILTKSPSAEEAIKAVSRTFMYGIDFPEEDFGNVRVRQRAIEWFKKEPFNVLPPAPLEDSEFVDPLNKINGLSVNFLRCYNIYNEISIYNLTPRASILELGAGAGHLARVFLSLENIKYTILDLPETLCFSYMHLKLCFPDKKMVYATSIEQLNEDCDVLFVPAVFAEHIKPGYDLFINTASMGEMPNETIRRFMDLIQNKWDVKHLYVLNRFLNTIGKESNDWNNQRRNENEASVLYDTKWDILGWDLEPWFTCCPYIDTLHARYLRIIAKRREQPLTLDHIDLGAIVDQDWFRVQPRISTMRDNTFRHALYKDGTLFQLWDLIRISPSSEAASLMLEYLNTLIRNPQAKEFEEDSYYRRFI